MQSIWLISTNTQFLSFFLFHTPSFIIFLYCTFEIKSHNMKFTSFPYNPCAICGMLLPLWFFLVPVQLHVDWLSHSPADPALTLPPISLNKLAQAHTWDSSSYSVPSEGDSDNGRWLCTFSSMCLLISQLIHRALISVQLKIELYSLACPVKELLSKLGKSRKVHVYCSPAVCQTSFNYFEYSEFEQRFTIISSLFFCWVFWLIYKNLALHIWIISACSSSWMKCF